ncbi:Fe-S cluster assembly protein SufD [Luteibaculum oceani]|uniref:Fe-S cluster assembly protein SufD n=1 Tax=Luteibaculum oceani TaxID=1294296 RepID=UPI001476DA61|nr:Fe-S cluster assembly protein SufD [Luteibaculum oceani]
MSNLEPNNSVLANPLSKEAVELLHTADFPTRKSEFWKYSRTAKIQNGNFSFQENNNFNFNNAFSNNTIDIVNGKIQGNNTQGIIVKKLEDCSSEELSKIGTIANFHRDVFSLMHQAFFQDVLVITVPESTVIEEAVQINIASTGNNSVSFPRIFICAEELSKSKFIINTESEGDNQLLYVQSEIHVEANAKLHLELNNSANSDFLITDTAANVESGAVFHINTLCFDGNWQRNNLDINLIGEFAHAELNGIVMPNGAQHFDNHTMVSHCVPNCTSSENYKNVVDGKGTAIFNGKIMVHQDAQKTNAFQSSSNILLSDNATVNAKPELEIYADDVKCSHGSTTGKLNSEALFYLQSRGVPAREAKKLLLKAFAAEVLESISVDAVKELAETAIDKKLA